MSNEENPKTQGHQDNQAAAAVVDSTAAAAAVVAAVAAAPAGIELEVPIQRGSQTITHVQLRRPKAGELRGIALGALLQLDASSVMQLLPRITQPTLVKHEVENLDPVDLVNLSQEVIDFLVSSKTLDVARAKQAEALDSLSA